MKEISRSKYGESKANRLLKNKFSWIIAIASILLSIRGLLVIEFDIPLAHVKLLSIGIAFLLVSYGFYLFVENNDQYLKNLRSILWVNLALSFFYIFFSLLLGVYIDAGVFYVLLAPYSIFVFKRLSDKQLYFIVLAIGIILTYSVVDNFYTSLSGPEGMNEVYTYNLKLKSEDETIGRSTSGGRYLRASGYTGNPHDSANILGMLSLFFFVKSLYKKKLYNHVTFLMTGLALFMTQSATNIMVFIFIIFIYLIIYFNRLYIYDYFKLFVGLLIVVYFEWETLTIFLSRIGMDGDWIGMTKGLDIDDWLRASLFIITGHADAFDMGVIYSELSYVKMLFNFGIIHFCILFAIMLYPLWQIKPEKWFALELAPAVAVVGFAFLSLLHFGSVFRGTNIFLFYIIYASLLKNTHIKFYR